MLRVHIWLPINAPNDDWWWIDGAADRADSAIRYVTHGQRQIPDVYAEGAGMRWGHAGIGFRDIATGNTQVTAYRAFWPRGERWTIIDPSPGVVRCDFNEDIREEGGNPTRSIVLGDHLPIQQDQVWTTWEQWRRNPPSYAALGTNCCNSVSQSIYQNLSAAPSEIESFVFRYGLPPSTPSSLEHWIDGLKSFFTARLAA